MTNFSLKTLGPMLAVAAILSLSACTAIPQESSCCCAKMKCCAEKMSSSGKKSCGCCDKAKPGEKKMCMPASKMTEMK